LKLADERMRGVKKAGFTMVLKDWLQDVE